MLEPCELEKRRKMIISVRMIFMIAAGMVSYPLRKQGSVGLLSEYIALLRALKEQIWIS